MIYTIQVETCKEKIISLELQDPVSGANKNENNNRAVEKDNDDEYEDAIDHDEEEEDAASIVTVHANDEKIFFKSDDEAMLSDEFENAFGHSSLDSGKSTNSSKIAIQPTLIEMHQTMSKEIFIDQSKTEGTQNIVEVVNPLIAGGGKVQKISVSHIPQADCAIFDKNEEGYDGTDNNKMETKYPTSRYMIEHSETFVFPTVPKQCFPKENLSLNAKMKNVLEELLENERVKLNWQKSLDDSDDAYQGSNKSRNRRCSDSLSEEDEYNNDNGGISLQKSQTYTTFKDAHNSQENEKTQSPGRMVEIISAEQQKLQEISKQIRQSVEDLLAGDSSAESDVDAVANAATNEELPKQIYRQQTEVTFETNIPYAGTIEGTTIVTKTTTTTNVTTSGIPRLVSRSNSTASAETAETVTASAAEGAATTSKNVTRSNSKKHKRGKQTNQQQKRKGKKF